MRNLLSFLLLLTTACAVSINDVKVSQVAGTSPYPSYADRFITPTINSLWGFDSNNRPINVTLGTNLSMTAGVLNASGSSGGVTTFSAGNASPLFTTNVATPTTTPALTFIIPNVTANSIYAGPTSGSPAPPSFRVLVTNDLPDTAVTPATYTLATVTVDSKGRVIAASNGTSGGAVSSVALALPSIFTVTGSPITTSGTLTGSLNTQTTKTFFSGPISGAAATPTFRVIATTDLPDLSGTYQPLNTKLTAIGALANGAGWLHNDGAGVFAYSTPTKTDVGLSNVTNNAQLTAVTATAPVVSSGGVTPVISMAQSSASVNGWLSSTDWSTFNSKQSAGAYITSVTSDAPLAGSGTSASHLSIPVATSSANGYLSSTDWSIFNSKQPAGSYLTGITVDAPLSGAGTSGSHLAIAQAGSSASGYLSATDWSTFNGKQTSGSYITTLTGDVSATGPGSAAATLANTAVTAGSYTAANITVDAKGRITSAANGSNGGTVTDVSVQTLNGFLGSVATSTTTPVITLSTTITGLLKGNGTAMSAASQGTDYSGGTSLLATGILKTTVSTGALSTAVAADFPTLNQSTTGSAATLSSGRTIAITGDLAYTSPSFNGGSNITAAGTLATVNSNVGSFTNANITVNGKGLITAASNGTAGGVTSIAGTANEITASSSTGAVTLSLPSALTFTGKTVTGGTFNSGAFNGTVGSGTPSTGAFTTISATTANINGLITALGADAAYVMKINSTSGQFRITPYFDATFGVLAEAVDSSGVTAKPLTLIGSNIFQRVAGVNITNATTTGLAVTGELSNTGFASNGGNKYQTADVAISSGTYVDLTGLTVNLVAGNTYSLRAVLYNSQATGTGANVLLHASGSLAASYVQNGFSLSMAAGSTITPYYTVVSALDTSVGSNPAISATLVRWEIDGTLVCSVSGTLTIQAARLVSGTTTFTKGSFLQVWPY